MKSYNFLTTFQNAPGDALDLPKWRWMCTIADPASAGKHLEEESEARPAVVVQILPRRVDSPMGESH